MNSESLYPEHVKLEAVADESQAIGAFLDTYLLQRYVLMQWEQGYDYDDAELVPVRATIEDMLAEYFGIDTKQLDAEKNLMLENWRKENNV